MGRGRRRGTATSASCGGSRPRSWSTPSWRAGVPRPWWRSWRRWWRPSPCASAGGPCSSWRCTAAGARPTRSRAYQRARHPARRGAGHRARSRAPCPRACGRRAGSVARPRPCGRDDEVRRGRRRVGGAAVQGTGFVRGRGPGPLRPVGARRRARRPGRALPLRGGGRPVGERQVVGREGRCAGGTARWCAAGQRDLADAGHDAGSATPRGARRGPGPRARLHGLRRPRPPRSRPSRSRGRGTRHRAPRRSARGGRRPGRGAVHPDPATRASAGSSWRR